MTSYTSTNGGGGGGDIFTEKIMGKQIFLKGIKIFLKRENRYF